MASTVTSAGIYSSFRSAVFLVHLLAGLWVEAGPTLEKGELPWAGRGLCRPQTVSTVLLPPTCCLQVAIHRVRIPSGCARPWPRHAVGLPWTDWPEPCL